MIQTKFQLNRNPPSSAKCKIVVIDHLNYEVLKKTQFYVNTLTYLQSCWISSLLT